MATVVAALIPLYLAGRSTGVARKAAGALDATPVLAAIRAAASPPAPPLTVKLVTFKDGSRAELSGSVSQIKVERDAKRHVDLRLLAGHARFEVVPNRKRSFEVQAGGVRVRVVGTSFSMARVSERTRVSVDKGLVQVFWSGGKADLAAGESGVFPPGSGEPADASAQQRGSAPEWRRLAQSGEYKGAYSALNAAPSMVREVPEDLMLAADVARLSGNPARAVPYLKTVSDRFSRDPRAPVAAFTLGRVFLENMGNAASAATAFRRARTLSPGGPLALDAWAREVESLRRAGRGEQASELAQKYLDQYPSGRHAGAMRGIAGK
jgi:transmembrane sensor